MDTVVRSYNDAQKVKQREAIDAGKTPEAALAEFLILLQARFDLI